MITLTIKGRIPSKKNSKIACVKNGRMCVFPSKAYTAWHKDASKQIAGVKPYKNITTLGLGFYAPDKRKADLTNKAESIMDLLVDCKVIEDDNWYVVDNIYMQFFGVDKDNPRCEVMIR